MLSLKMESVINLCPFTIGSIVSPCCDRLLFAQCRTPLTDQEYNGQGLQSIR